MDMKGPRNVQEIRKLPRSAAMPPEPEPHVWRQIGRCNVIRRPADGHVRKTEAFFVFGVGDSVNPIAMRSTWAEVCDLMGIWPMERQPEERPTSRPSEKGPPIPIEQWEAERPLLHRGKPLPPPPPEQMGWWDAMLDGDGA